MLFLLLLEFLDKLSSKCRCLVLLEIGELILDYFLLEKGLDAFKNYFYGI